MATGLPSQLHLSGSSRCVRSGVFAHRLSKVLQAAIEVIAQSCGSIWGPLAKYPIGLSQLCAPPKHGEFLWLLSIIQLSLWTKINSVLICINTTKHPTSSKMIQKVRGFLQLLATTSATRAPQNSPCPVQPVIASNAAFASAACCAPQMGAATRRAASSSGEEEISCSVAGSWNMLKLYGFVWKKHADSTNIAIWWGKWWSAAAGFFVKLLGWHCLWQTYVAACSRTAWLDLLNSILHAAVAVAAAVAKVEAAAVAEVASLN